MSEDKKDSSFSSDSSDPLFDALSNGKSNGPKKDLKAAVETELPVPVVPKNPKPVTSEDSESGFKHFLKDKLTRKEFIIGSIIFVLLLGGLVAFGIVHRASAPMVAKKSPPPPPVVYYSPLTGLKVSKADTKRPVTAVMIENSDFARPQSGLLHAGVVFEAIAEAGITRFMALYQEAKPGNIGPIRSARPYYVGWSQAFDAGYAHVGGSPEALADIKNWHVKDMNEFYYGSYYHRISTREAPHNMYSGMAQLNAIEKKNGWNTSKFTGFTRKSDSPSKHPLTRQINFSISSPDFYVMYKYDAKYNAYKRWLAGVPHLDAGSKVQLEPKVVIGIVLPYSLESDGYHSMYNEIGSGKAYVFQDGSVTIGKWTKLSRQRQITFIDKTGKTIELNRGQTWITALSSASQVSYKP